MNSKQQEVLDLVKSGENVFITGSAGTGKSYVINNIVDYLEDIDKKFIVTATTGCAAAQIGGITLHSWAGIGLGSKNLTSNIRCLTQRGKLEAWKTIDVLIIDEVSMLDFEYFTLLMKIASRIRNSKRPFGGVQLIFVGDFCQLGPINGKFIFEQESLWGGLSLKTIELTEIMRQQDEEFVKILQKLRLGECSESDREILMKGKLKNDTILPTKIRSTNKQVNSINKKKLDELSKNNKIYRYSSTYSIPGSQQYFTDITPDLIEICVGCQILVTYNIDVENEVVNGSRGIVTECFQSHVNIRLLNGMTIPIRKVQFTVEVDNQFYTKNQLPLKLAYAISIHKCQGMTIDYMEVDLGDSIFCHGQSYTAISRARTIDGLVITNFNTSRIICNNKVVNYYKNLET